MLSNRIGNSKPEKLEHANAYQSLSWTVYRRFSEFDSLMMELTGCGHAFLPPLPPKTLVRAPMATSDTIRTRTHALHILLRRLIQRPDTRSSPPFLRCPFRFAVTGMQVNATQTIVIASHEDSTAMARLGRVWSVVEADELGSINVYHRVKSVGGPPPYEGRGR
ncbi:hypothetical protein Pmar_PMAR024815 [Perkinsus marinus ATCC 50983]|uniref:PX domain-containing protein n=1 Tax=Perkinsus marinus (strain ATCC 50983 / TXsc) TaxID=423536 RepID=C5M189_PERM5|nr:hypothetical protein Pmar_PMAR024815 [Perkinsus marinus ATCC 50983]EEQ97319.1 hypothetical protein Pmar_PMAR024815 [Perkinsus marinus ATCC 50983]|eukprot:XP_002764602.1 hypothetical protein Pmar_PMAR024815 [Perkinsus marinus ATCC 50983]